MSDPRLDVLPPPTPAPAPKPSGIGSGFTWTGTILGALAGIVLGVGLAWGGGYLLKCWWNNVPPPVPAPISLTVDANTPPHVGRRILIHADTAGTLVKWRMLSAPIAENQYDLWSETNSHDENLTTPIAGQYRLEGITVVGGEAFQAEINVLVDVGPTPIPPGPIPPGPTPGPIPAGQLRVLLTFDEDTYPTDQAAQKVLNDTSIRRYISSKGQGKFVSNKVQFTDEPAMKPWKDAFAKQKQLGITIFNGANGQVAYEGPLPKSVDETLKLLQTYGGP